MGGGASTTLSRKGEGASTGEDGDAATSLSRTVNTPGAPVGGSQRRKSSLVRGVARRLSDAIGRDGRRASFVPKMRMRRMSSMRQQFSDDGTLAAHEVKNEKHVVRAAAVERARARAHMRTK